MESDSMSERISSALHDRARQALGVALPQAMAVELADPDDPLAGVTIVADGLALTPYGTLHGAALAAAVELAGFLAVMPTLEADQHAVTHQIATQYLRAAAAGQRVLVRGRLDRRTRSLGFVTVDAHVVGHDGASDDEPVLVARSQITKSIVAL